MTKVPREVAAFADLLKCARRPRPSVSLGELKIAGKSGDLGALQYNERDFELLGGALDYVFTIGGTAVQFSAQLYLNLNNHYRLFAFTRTQASPTPGMTFSLNLTTERDAKGIVFLTQKLAFREGRAQSESARGVRQAKTRMFADVLLRCGVTVTDNLEVELGMFSAKTGEFLNTTPENFLNQFMAIALVKGHFQGNKGYQLACLPRYDDSFPWKWDSTEAVRQAQVTNRRGAKGIRAVPLALRYQVLERDKVCCACGNGPHDHVTLHVDHIHPHSLRGLTKLSNLQILCSDCNLGKGNRSSADLRRKRTGQ